MYYLLLEDLTARTRFIERMRAQGIGPVFHYIPLHSSPFGRLHARAQGSLAVTDASSDRLVRLPLWIGLEEELDRVIAATIRATR